jgi:hypothetical protein
MGKEADIDCREAILARPLEMNARPQNRASTHTRSFPEKCAKPELRS